LNQDLAAIAQAEALFELVNDGDGFVLQPEQHFLFARSRNAAPVGANVLGDFALVRLHDNIIPAQITCKESYD
jgi:hypothetical protein